MMAPTRNCVALELRLAIEALIGAPGPETYNQLSCMFAALMRSGVTGKAIDLGTATLVEVCDRYERVGKVGVSGVEADDLRRAGAGLDADLCRVPLNKFREAVAVVTFHFEGMTA